MNTKLCDRENFSKFSVRNRLQIAVPHLANTRNIAYGPLRVVRRLRVIKRHGFRCDLARFRTQNFAAAKIFRKFRSEIRSESRAISRAAACRRSAEWLGTCEGREQAGHHLAAWILARSHAISNAKFCGREIFRKFRSEIRSESHEISRGTACRHSQQMFGTSNCR